MKSRHNSSTLHNETGNISLYRVSEETRRKVAEDTQKIEDDMKKHNLASRKRFKQEDSARCRANEQNHLKMVDRWKQKTITNPLSVDLYAQEELRKQRAAERERLKKIDDNKISLVASMTGKDDADVVTPRHTMPLDRQTKLNLAIRSLTLDETVIKREKSVLNDQLHEQLLTIINRFPPLETVNHSLFPQSESISSMRESLKSSLHKSKQEASVWTAGSSHRAQRSYISPAKQAQMLQDDVSLQFRVSPLPLDRA